MNDQYWVINNIAFKESDLRNKYGDQFDSKVAEHNGSRAYKYNDMLFSESDLRNKYGDQFDSKIEEHGFVPYTTGSITIPKGQEDSPFAKAFGGYEFETSVPEEEANKKAEVVALSRRDQRHAPLRKCDPDRTPIRALDRGHRR